MLLAGDIGGTKTELAVFSQEGGPRRPLTRAAFPSARYPSLEAVVHEFLAGLSDLGIDPAINHACFGVAGPVVNGRASVTNLPWVIDVAQLESKLGLTAAYLLNDLESIANAVPILEPGDLHTLNEGLAVSEGAIAVVAPGTGLGEAFLTWDSAYYVAHPSEGGHTDFAPTDELQIGLLRYLMKTYDHISYERICSGLGLPNVYLYLKESGYATEPAWLADQMAASDDINPIIVSNALSDDPCELCAAALHTFVAVLGAEAGNLAVKVLATGGVYLGGGIPPRILPALRDKVFMRAFLNKGRFAGLLERMPVHVILNTQSAIMGVAHYGLGRMG